MILVRHAYARNPNFNCLFSSVILDYAKGFGGKYGVQKDRMDKVHRLTHRGAELGRLLTNCNYWRYDN